MNSAANLEGLLEDEIVLLSKVTLIIPTYNRGKFLERAVKYYCRTPIKILIADGSDKKNSTVELISEHSNSITYIFKPKLNFIDRLHYLNGLIETDYSLWMGDDEFHLITGIVRSAKILEERKEIVSVIGRSMTIGYNEKYSSAYIRKGYMYEACAVKGTIAERIQKYFCNYTPTIDYSIMRTEVFKSAWDFVVKINSIRPGSHELYRSLYVLLCGDHLIHKEYQWLRSDENNQIKENHFVSNENDSDLKFIENMNAKRFITLNKDITSECAELLISLMYRSHEWFVSNRTMLEKLGLVRGKLFEQSKQFNLHMNDKNLREGWLEIKSAIEASYVKI